MKGLFLIFLAAVSSTALAEDQTPNIVNVLMSWIDLVAQLTFALTIVATVIVRLIPGDKDDIAVGKAKEKIRKFFSYLPTFGINPKTKKLEEALKDLEVKK